jgi:hypothetical protein
MLKRWPETPRSIIAAIAPSLYNVAFAVSRAGLASVPVPGDRRKPRFRARCHIRSRHSRAIVRQIGIELRAPNERPRIEGCGPGERHGVVASRLAADPPSGGADRRRGLGRALGLGASQVAVIRCRGIARIARRRRERTPTGNPIDASRAQSVKKSLRYQLA